MTYSAGPVESYETPLGCAVVRQLQTNHHGLLIEHVALIGPKDLCEQEDQQPAAEGRETVSTTTTTIAAERQELSYGT